jgi:pyruvate dehydrogenase E1 component alpha subunit
MTDRDVMLTTYREQPAQIWRGVTLTELLQFWGGDERGFELLRPARGLSRCRARLAVSARTRSAWRPRSSFAKTARRGLRARRRRHLEGRLLRIRQSSRASGSLPVVFMVINNYWAISCRARSRPLRDAGAKGIAGGIPGIQVDGNDIIAVRDVMDEAMERARNGGGPTVVEALTYRMGDHTTADDASRYRTEELVSAAWKLDPWRGCAPISCSQHWWTKSDEEQLIAQCREQVDAAVAEYLALPPPRPPRCSINLFESCRSRSNGSARNSRVALMAEITMVARSQWRSPARCRTIRACSCSAKTSASTAACSARPMACRRASARARARHAARGDRARRHVDRYGAQGFRPVTEFQFMGFIYPALDQVINHAGRLRNRSRGRLSCPIVFRSPSGPASTRPSIIRKRRKPCSRTRPAFAS